MGGARKAWNLALSNGIHNSCWSDLMGCFDIALERIDVFERNADRISTGGLRYIDFFWSGVVIAKSHNVPLGRAYDQVLGYLNGDSAEQEQDY